MINITKRCQNCEHFDTCEAIGAVGKPCDDWQESELSKCKRKLEITVAWLEVISKTSTNTVDRSSAYHVISKLKEMEEV